MAAGLLLALSEEPTLALPAMQDISYIYSCTLSLSSCDGMTVAGTCVYVIVCAGWSCELIGLQVCFM